MPKRWPRRPQIRTTVPVAARRALVGTIAGVLCISASHAADEGEEKALPPHHPYLAPARSLAEMANGGHVERAIERSARALFPKLAQGTLPDTEFGVIVLPSFWPPSVVLFREADGGTLVEKRELDHGIRLRDLTDDEVPRTTTESRLLDPEIATASISAIRRALVNVRLHRRGNTVVLDGVSFYFFSAGSVGKAHSPGSATEAGQLVQLVWSLKRFVDGEVDVRELRVAAENALRANHGSTEEN